MIAEFKRIISESEITKEDDRNWPEPDKIGRQELEIKLDKEHISFTVSILLVACLIPKFELFVDAYSPAAHFAIAPLDPFH